MILDHTSEYSGLAVHPVMSMMNVPPLSPEPPPILASAIRSLTHAVVGILVLSSVLTGVDVLGVPVKVGEASVAYFCALTYAVVAICVVLVDVLAVGAFGVPVKVGLASLA